MEDEKEESKDASHLDKQYFVDSTRFNCPFCNRNHVPFAVEGHLSFDWTSEKKTTAFVVSCQYCGGKSLHLTYSDLLTWDRNGRKWIKHDVSSIDDQIFYSVPTSFFVLDNRIPRPIRELITEADGCRKMNYLTGASACARKAIYVLLVHEEIEGESYDDRIKALKSKHPNVTPEYFDVLGAIQSMTSDKVHEQSWPKWDSRNLGLILETLKAVLYEMYVLPDQKKARVEEIRRLREEITVAKRAPSTVVDSTSALEPSNDEGASG